MLNCPPFLVRKGRAELVFLLLDLVLIKWVVNKLRGNKLRQTLAIFIRENLMNLIKKEKNGSGKNEKFKCIYSSVGHFDKHKGKFINMKPLSSVIENKLLLEYLFK